MAKAKKLPSGQWRTLVYSHTEKVNGKDKRIYESFTADTKKESEYLAAEFSLNKKKKSKPMDMTVGEAIDKYLNNKSNILSPATIRAYKIYKNTRLQSIMSIKFKDLTQDLIQSSINDDAKTVSPKTVRNAHGLLSATLKEYYPSFTLNTVMPQKIKREISIPTLDEINILLNKCKEQNLRRAIILAYALGLRRSEICALKLSDINFSNNTININKAVVLNYDNGWDCKTTKTTSSTRILSMPDVVRDELKKCTCEKIIALTPTNISNNFRTLVKQCKLQHIRFHDLRHFNASMMLSLNIPDKYAMEIMGHSTNNMLKTVYQHTMQNKMNDVYTQVNNFLNMQHEMQHKTSESQ